MGTNLTTNSNSSKLDHTKSKKLETPSESGAGRDPHTLPPKSCLESKPTHGPIDLPDKKYFEYTKNKNESFHVPVVKGVYSKTTVPIPHPEQFISLSFKRRYSYLLHWY